MHNVYFANAPGRTALLGRCLARFLTGTLLAVLSATPALAQEAPASRSGSVLNILLLVVVAYFLVRAYRRRSGGGDDNSRPGRWTRPDDRPDDQADYPARPDDRSGDAPQGRRMDRHEAARMTWEMLSSDKQTRPEPTTPTGAPVRADGFDEAEFLEGAKLFFSRYQQAAGEDDYRAIRDFMSDEAYDQAVAAATGERTEVMLVSARLMELKSENNRTVASVFYDAQLRVGEDGRAVQLRTVWDFARDDSVPGGLWVLERINSIDQ